MEDSHAVNTWKIFAIVSAITIALYGWLHVRSAEWVYEDSTWRRGGVVEHPLTASSDQTKFMPSPLATLAALPNRHLAMWTFYLTPDDPRVAHAINVGLHLLNALLLALLLQRWGLSGWVAGAVFVAYPLTTQAVAYAAGRSELLSLTSVLGTIWFASASDAHVVTRWVGFVVSWLVGLASKPTVAIIVPLLLLWVFICQRDWMTKRRNHLWLPGLQLELWFAFALMLGVMAYRVLDGLKADIPLWRWIAVQTSGAWTLLVNPFHLSMDHAWFLTPDPLQIASLIAWFLFGAWLVLSDASREIRFGLGWFWLAILPRLFVRDQLGWMREHHVYVAVAGLAIAISAWYESMVPSSEWERA